MACRAEHKKPEPIHPRIRVMRNYPNRAQRRHPSPSLAESFEANGVTPPNQPYMRTGHPLNKKQREELRNGKV